MADWALTNSYRRVAATLGELSEEREWEVAGDLQGLYVPAEYPAPFQVWPTYPDFAPRLPHFSELLWEDHGDHPPIRLVNAGCNFHISAGWIFSMNARARANPASGGTATAEGEVSFTVTSPVEVRISAGFWVYGGQASLTGPSGAFNITSGWHDQELVLDAGDYTASLSVDSIADVSPYSQGRNSGCFSIGPPS